MDGANDCGPLRAERPGQLEVGYVSATRDGSGKPACPESKRKSEPLNNEALAGQYFRITPTTMPRTCTSFSE